jgi:hypothetical protein
VIKVRYKLSIGQSNKHIKSTPQPEKRRENKAKVGKPIKKLAKNPIKHQWAILPKKPVFSLGKNKLIINVCS